MTTKKDLQDALRRFAQELREMEPLLLQDHPWPLSDEIPRVLEKARRGLVRIAKKLGLWRAIKRKRRKRGGP